MEVAEFRGMSPAVWPIMQPEEWTDRLQSVCGHFRPEPCKENPVVTGLVEIADAAGVELVHVANDMNVVRRDESDIRRDYGENIFLRIQLQGMCCLEQCGRQAAIGPGDCVLMDSVEPSGPAFRGPLFRSPLRPPSAPIVDLRQGHAGGNRAPPRRRRPHVGHAARPRRQAFPDLGR